MTESEINWIYQPPTWQQADQAGFAEAVASFRSSRLDVSPLSLDVLLDTLHSFGQSLVRKEFQGIAGLSFLIFWLRRKNLEQLLELNFGSRLLALNQTIFVDGIGVQGTARGLVSHWVAGNVATLAVFSWAMAALTNNRSLIRISTESQEEARQLFGALRDFEADSPRLALGKEHLLANLAVLHFPTERMEWHQAMSEAADVRLMWGGREAIEALRNLPCLDYAEDLIFGPKFSIALMDRDALADEPSVVKFSRALATDIAAFNQTACSSPQILFVQGDSVDAPEVKRLVDTLTVELPRALDRLSTGPNEGHVNMQIFSARAEYAMKEIALVRSAANFRFSLLVDRDLSLVEAVQHGTLYIKVFQQLEDLLELISPKIQTVGIGIISAEKRNLWQASLTQRGVARCVSLGTMNYFEHPWDGLFPLDRLVRWSRHTA